jgi:hypothetical protein
MIARLALALLLLAATPALAQATPPEGPPPAGAQPAEGPTAGEGPEGHRRPMQIFISPAGEPFRAPFGEPYPVATWFNRADTDHDGVLTQEEFVADALTFFASLDTDHDGIVDGFEIGDYESKVAPEILSRIQRGDDQRDGPAMGPPPWDPGKKRGGQLGLPPSRSGGRPLFGGGPPAYGVDRTGAGLYGLINEAQPVSGQDRDLNRRIDRAEAVFAAKDRFSILDFAKNGKLTLATLPKTPLQAVLERQAAERAKR